MLELKIEKREEIGKPKKLREAGFLPAVFYSAKEKSTPISVSYRDFEKVYKEAGESTVITLSGIGKPKEVLIHEVDFDPVTSIPRHADFYVIEEGKKVSVKVPLEFTGEASAVKDLGGNLVKVLHDIEIEVPPKDLPQHLDVDISGLVDFTSRVFAKDIKLPASAELITKEDEVVALVAEAVEEVEEVVETPDLESIEVETKGKEEEGTEEGRKTPAAETKEGAPESKEKEEK
jgi:large subunit ribosomal protein L25